MLIILGLIFIFGCYFVYVNIMNNNASRGGNHTDQYLVEDEGIYEDDTFQEYQEYEEEEEEVDDDYMNQSFYDDTSYDTDSYDTQDTMHDEDTYRSFFSDEERY